MIQLWFRVLIYSEGINNYSLKFLIHGSSPQFSPTTHLIIIISAGVLFRVTKISIKGHVPFRTFDAAAIYRYFGLGKTHGIRPSPFLPPPPDRRLEQKDSNGPPVTVMMSPLCPWPRRACIYKTR